MSPAVVANGCDVVSAGGQGRADSEVILSVGIAHPFLAHVKICLIRVSRFRL